jgi:hypothetical protein
MYLLYDSDNVTIGYGFTTMKLVVNLELADFVARRMFVYIELVCFAFACCQRLIPFEAPTSLPSFTFSFSVPTTT